MFRSVKKFQIKVECTSLYKRCINRVCLLIYTAGLLDQALIKIPVNDEITMPGRGRFRFADLNLAIKIYKKLTPWFLLPIHLSVWARQKNQLKLIEKDHEIGKKYIKTIKDKTK
jgi:hypothetical protein